MAERRLFSVLKGPARLITGAFFLASLNAVNRSSASAEGSLSNNPVYSGRQILYPNGNSLIVEDGALKASPVIEYPEIDSRSPEEKLMQKEKDRVMQIIADNPWYFTEQDLKDIDMYFAVYFEAAKKYNLRWYLLPVVHWEESHASRNPRAFDGSSGFQTGMQLDFSHAEGSFSIDALDDVPEYILGLETRDETDVRAIFIAAKKLDADGRELGHGEDPNWKAVDALTGYLSHWGDTAVRRYNKYTELQEFFEPQMLKS